MGYLTGVPMYAYRGAFAYDPASPSGLVRLRSRVEFRACAAHVHKIKSCNSFLARFKIDGKDYSKRFLFGRNGKSEWQAKTEAKSWAISAQRKRLEARVFTGYQDDRGYWHSSITYNGKCISFLAHRLVFALCNPGTDVEGMGLDHADNNPANNKIENLRPCTQSQNGCNQKLSKANTTGIKGLVAITKRNMFGAQIGTKGMKRTTKAFCYGANATDARKEEVKAIAIKWLRETRERLHGEYTNHGDRVLEVAQ